MMFKKVMKGLMYGLFGAAFAVLIGFVFMWLWNWLMPEIFGWGAINFWQSVGLILMGKILFGFSKGHSRHKHCKHCGGKGQHKSSYWRDHYRKKMAGMTPEQRAQYKEKVKKCWGYDPDCDDEDDTEHVELGQGSEADKA